jgi:hypothetical protein
MNGIRRSVFARSFLLPLAFLLWLSGCHTWAAIEPPFAQTLERRTPGTVRVTTNDGRTIMVDDPRVADDSLLVFFQGVTEWEHGQPKVERRPARMPLGDVSRLDERRANPIGTIAIVLGGLLAIGMIAGAAAFAGDGVI